MTVSDGGPLVLGNLAMTRSICLGRIAAKTPPPNCPLAIGTQVLGLGAECTRRQVTSRVHSLSVAEALIGGLSGSADVVGGMRDLYVS